MIINQKFSVWKFHFRLFFAVAVNRKILIDKRIGIYFSTRQRFLSGSPFVTFVLPFLFFLRSKVWLYCFCCTEYILTVCLCHIVSTLVINVTLCSTSQLTCLLTRRLHWSIFTLFFVEYVTMTHFPLFPLLVKQTGKAKTKCDILAAICGQGPQLEQQHQRFDRHAVILTD